MNYLINNIKYLLLATVILALASCQEEVGTIGDLSAPKDLSVTANVNEDGSGIVNFNANAEGSIVYHYFLGVSDTENPTVSSDGNLMAVYRSSGDYTVRVIAYGPGGIASNTTIDISVNVVYEAPADLIQILTGGDSRQWQWEKDVPGHLGVGPLTFDDGTPAGEPIWYTAQPFEKESEGCLYEDVITFSLDGNNVNYELNNFGTTFFNKDKVVAATGGGDPSEDGCYEFTVPTTTALGFFESNTGITNTTNISFLLGNNGFMSYYLGTSTYEILSYTDNEIYVRCIQSNEDGFMGAWYQRFKATDAVTVEPEIEYELVWEDDFTFNGAPSSARWSYDLGDGNGWGNNEEQFYTDRSDNVFIENGILNIIAKRENFNGSQYTSTRMKTQDKYEFTYGKVEIRAQLPSGEGTWPALWMLGANFDVISWPGCGEIDIMEHVGNDQNVIHSSLHSPSSFGGTVNTGTITVNGVSDEFHVYEVEWTADKIVFSVDGNSFYTYQPENKNAENWPFDSDQFLIMNVAMGGTFGGDINPQFTESRMLVDYVKVYQEVE